MSKTLEHTFWIDSIRLSEIDDIDYIPTKLCYFDNDKKPSFGQEAVTHSKKNKITNENFKVQLGEIKPGAPIRNSFLTESGQDKSAYNLTKDYFDLILSDIEKKIGGVNQETGKVPAKIMIAEPLAFQVANCTSNWISNYRGNIRRILNRYKIVEFLPEPFAVYQYYRYGLKIPQLQDNSKHIALILDFGGGTFDACIIESTNKGDISLTGKHSKPLASASCPVGGYFINEAIALYLIKRGLDGADRALSDQTVEAYRSIKKGTLKLSALNDKKQSFIKNLEKIQHNVEQYKIQLSNQINDWNIKSDADNYKKVKIRLPDDPFKCSSWHDSEFFAHEFKKLYINDIWNYKISKIIKSVLKISTEVLKGRSITTTLISGGSSNIKWLSELLTSEFKDFLENAEPLPLSTSFQEIVAKGLAIECARRNYESSSEFVSVTYNPVSLILNPDNKGEERKKYKPIDCKVDMEGTKPGDLIPSAQSLVNFIDSPVQWKVKLSHAPKTSLKYFFFRGIDSDDTLDRYNIENDTVYTKEKRFDSQIYVELTVREDGTVLPKFIYKKGNSNLKIPENSVTAEPFVIDMTSDSQGKLSADKYIGLDFGTSNSSICELSTGSIRKIKKRSTDESWIELKDALKDLPYPVALSLRKYLDANNSKDSATVGRDAFESVLAFAAYTAAAEAMAHGKLGKTMKSFQHRSLGPLRALLEKSLGALGSKAEFSKEYTSLFTTHLDQFTLALNEFNNHKHDKLESKDIDVHGHLRMLINICRIAMKDKYFGFCNQLDKVPFEDDSYLGDFKLAHDVQPFIETLKYKGKHQYLRNDSLIYNNVDSTCLNLSPFLLWFDNEDYTTHYSCVWFDKVEDEDVTLKPCDKKGLRKASHISDGLVRLYNELIQTGLPKHSSITYVSIQHT